LTWKKSFKLPWNGKMFRVSITKFYLKEFAIHTVLHAGLAWAFGIGVSLGMALAIEWKDGESGNNEGFNIFPDLVSRVLGIFIWDMLSRL